MAKFSKETVGTGYGYVAGGNFYEELDRVPVDMRVDALSVSPRSNESGEVIGLVTGVYEGDAFCGYELVATVA